MKNQWLRNKTRFPYPCEGPVCAAISCSKDEVPGCCIWDLEGRCITKEDFLSKVFEAAIEIANRLTVIGKADKIVLMSCSKKYLFDLPSPEEYQKAKKIKAFYTWYKVGGLWVS